MKPTTSTQSLSDAARATRATRVSKRTVRAATDYTINRVVVIRESAKKAARGVAGKTEFALIGQQTLDRHDVRDLPGAAVLRPMLDELIANNAAGRALRESLNALTITDPHHPRVVIGHLIKFDDVAYFLCVTSAKKPTIKVENDIVDMSNAFTVALAQLVTKYGVKHLHAARLDRLIRNEIVAKDLMAALTHCGTLVHGGSADYNMNNPQEAMMFSMMGAIAAGSVKGTITGLTNGWHAIAERGEWPFAETALPGAGYRLVSETDLRIIPDSAQLDLVRDLIGWAADPELTLTDIATKLAQAHGSATRPRPSSTPATQRPPSSRCCATVSRCGSTGCTRSSPASRT